MGRFIAVPNPSIRRTVDDVCIFVRAPFDFQPGPPLAPLRPETGYTFQIRASDSLPILSAIRLNTDLLDDIGAQGQLEDLMLHELGHCLRVEISWYHFGLLGNSSRQKPDRRQLLWLVFKQDRPSINWGVGRIEAERCPYNKAAMMCTGEQACSAMN